MTYLYLLVKTVRKVKKAGQQFFDYSESDIEEEEEGEDNGEEEEGDEDENSDEYDDEDDEEDEEEEKPGHKERVQLEERLEELLRVYEERRKEVFYSDKDWKWQWTLEDTMPLHALVFSIRTFIKTFIEFDDMRLNWSWSIWLNMYFATLFKNTWNIYWGKEKK